jgi:predicted metal-dependent peptidase
MSLSTADRITKQHIWLMGHKPTMHYSGIVMVGDVDISDALPTAGTNGRDVTYNPQFVDSLTEQQLRGLVLHEAGHKAYQHLFLWQELYKEDAKLANMACDYVINLEIYDLDPRGVEIALPPNPCLDEKYRGMDTKQVFELLKQDKANGGQGGKGEPMDDHQWEDAQALPEEERQALAKEIDNAIRQGVFMSGKLGGDVSRGFNALLEPKVDWRDQLRDYVSTVTAGRGDSTWARPNRRFMAMDLYLPSQISESIGNIVVGIDTSGSISGEAITAALSELVGICNNTTPERVDLLYWDTRVVSHETYFEGDYESIATSTKPAGGGGSSCVEVFEYIKDNKLDPLVCIHITDGFIEYPQLPPNYPVLWVICNGSDHHQPPFGSFIRVKL